jgi:hypothetical protein
MLKICTLWHILKIFGMDISRLLMMIAVIVVVNSGKTFNAMLSTVIRSRTYLSKHKFIQNIYINFTCLSVVNTFIARLSNGEMRFCSTWGKGKVVPVHNQAPCHKDVRGSGGIAPAFSTLALDGGEWSASNPGCFTPGTHWIGGWVSPRAGLDSGEEKNLLPLPSSL